MSIVVFTHHFRVIVIFITRSSSFLLLRSYQNFSVTYIGFYHIFTVLVLLTVLISEVQSYHSVRLRRSMVRA